MDATASNGKVAEVTENDIVTLAAPPTLPLPTISVTREPNPMVAGRDFTLRWSTTHTATLTRKCTAAIAGGFVSDGAMVIAAIDATTSTGSLPAAKADVNWVGKPSTCTWTATSKEGKTKEFTETMTTDAAPTGPQITYIHTDGLGSPVARTDEKGVIISRTRYEPYGATAGGATPTIGFTGHVNDADTGLTYMQQRYYDPVAGRFMSVDPVLTDANTGSSFNRYVYANNSPYKYIDPDGRDSILGTIIKSVFKAIFKAESKAAPKQAQEGAKGAAKTEAKAGAKVEGEAAKRGPKTDPTAPHNAKIREVGDKIEAEGGQITAGGGRRPEKVVDTAGGLKDTRRPDVMYKDAQGTERAVNVGKTNAAGEPVTREAGALKDLNGPGKLPTTFVPYN